MILADGEGHQLLHRHLVLGVDVEEFWRDRCEAHPLLDHARGDEKARGDLLVSEAFVSQGLERPELIERMQRGALHILRERILLGEAPVRTTQGTGAVFDRRFCFTSNSSAR